MRRSELTVGKSRRTITWRVKRLSVALFSRLRDERRCVNRKSRAKEADKAAFKEKLTMPMPQRVQYSDAIEPLVQFIEETAPEEIVDRALDKLRAGVSIPRRPARWLRCASRPFAC